MPQSEEEIEAVAEKEGVSQTAETSISEFSLIRVLNRYISVWIWSILIGLAMTLSLTATRGLQFAQYGMGGLLLTIFALPIALNLFRAWGGLIRYLREFIVPVLMFDASTKTLAASGDRLKDLVEIATCIFRGFIWYVVLLFARELMEISYSGGFGFFSTSSLF